MAGVTDGITRRLCFEQGCDYAVTEMVSAQGYMTAPRDAHAYRYMLQMLPGEGRVFCQLFGREPEWFARAIGRLLKEESFCGFDINMGCPAHKVTGGGNGSALMKNPLLAGQIMEACVKASPLPVTVKMRLGWDEERINCLELGHMAQEAGIAFITLHARTRAQGYSGRADWEWIARLKETVSIPVIGNGDVTDARSALEMLRTTHCDGIAVGRGALGNPWIFREIACALENRPFVPPSRDEILGTARRHALELAQLRGEHRAVLEMRKHFSWYISGMRGAAQLRTRINQAQSLEEVFSLLEEEP